MANTIKLPRLFGNYTAEGALIMANNKLDYFNEYLNKLEHPELFEERKPKFKVGDVVVDIVEKYEKDLDLEYFIRDAILVDDGDNPPEYVYEVGLTCRPERTYKIKEDQLELNYHDVNWAEYVTERVGSDLPDWRGKLYNLYMFYKNPMTHNRLMGDRVEAYNNDTIPPAYMKHILENHSVYDRLDKVLSKTENQNIVIKNLRITSLSKLLDLKDSIQFKINKRNETDILSSPKERRLNNDRYKFTADERSLVYQVSLLDIETDEDTGEGRYKDQYKLDMTNLQIMQAIQEAYGNAVKIKERKHQPNKDRRNETRLDKDKIKEPEPVEGRRLYEGYSSTHELIIQFWYNFDMNLIETAYPVGMNNNAMKH